MSAVAIVRAIHFACLMIIFGSESLKTLFQYRLKPRVESGLPERFAPLCAALALLTAILWLVAVASQVSGQPLFDLAAIVLVLQTTWFGHVAIARFVLLTGLVVATLGSRATLARVALSAGSLVTIALTSHAAAAGDPHYLGLRATNDALHLLAAGFWLGGLTQLVPMVLGNRENLQRVLPVLRLFSSVGMVAVCVLVIAGTLNGYLILFGDRGMWSPAYIGMLAFKIVLAAIMIALAATNRLHVLPAIAQGEPEGATTIAISTILELALGLGIVLLVGVLGALPPMRG